MSIYAQSMPLKSTKKLRNYTQYSDDDKLLKFADEVQLLRKERKQLKYDLAKQSYNIEQLKQKQKDLEEKLDIQQQSSNKKVQLPTSGMIRALENQLKISLNDNQQLYKQLSILKEKEDFQIYMNLESQLKQIFIDTKKEQELNQQLLQKLGVSVSDNYQLKASQTLHLSALVRTNSVEHIPIQKQ